MKESGEKRYIQKIIRLLVLSACLNVGMVAFLYWWTVKEAPPIPLCASRPVERAYTFSPSKMRVFSELSAFSKEELFAALYDKTLVEDGYRRRDLSLSLLVTDHMIDLDRALAGTKWKGDRRLFQFDEKAYFLFPSLQDRHFDLILQFLEREKWPLTSKGLFLALKAGIDVDPSLKSSFFLTSEFFLVKELFQRSSEAFSDNEILDLLLEGDFEPLSLFAEKQKVAKDLSTAARRSFLFPYLKSAKGALFLFRIDPDFIVRQLSDEAVLALFYLVRGEQNPAIEGVAKKLLAAPRGSALWIAARSRIGELQDAAQEEALMPGIKKVDKQKRYMVRSGDSLWKIARRFGTSVRELMRLNDLETERIRPGKELIIASE